MENLKALAKLKIKLDLYEEQYEKQIKELKEKYKSGEIEDPDGLLKIKLVPSSKRIFSIDGIREVFKEKAGVCIEEKVEASKFDAIAKSKKEYTISKEEQDKCFTTVPQNPSFVWDGLEVYKQQLIMELKSAK